LNSNICIGLCQILTPGRGPIYGPRVMIPTDAANKILKLCHL